MIVSYLLGFKIHHLFRRPWNPWETACPHGGSRSPGIFCPTRTHPGFHSTWRSAFLRQYQMVFTEVTVHPLTSVRGHSRLPKKKKNVFILGIASYIQTCGSAVPKSYTATSRGRYSLDAYMLVCSTDREHTPTPTPPRVVLSNRTRHHPTPEVGCPPILAHIGSAGLRTHRGTPEDDNST